VSALAHFIQWRLGLEKGSVWTAPDEAAALVRHAANKQRLAEIGVWEGGTTRRLRQVMASGGMLFAIDPFPTGRLGISYQQAIAKGEVGGVRNGTVVWLRLLGIDAAKHPDVIAVPFDFVFIDGDHTYDAARADWEAWSALVAPGGIIALHDSVPVDGQDDSGMTLFSEEVIRGDRRFESVENVRSLRVLRRR
jgi:predicted O-methyltransferase YrrM